MGMPVRLVLYATDEAAARAAATSAFARIAVLDGAMSDYRPDSEINAIARVAPQALVVSRDVFRVVSRAIEIARLTDGAFDPTVAPLVALWRDARKTGRFPAPAAIEAARAITGWRGVELDAARQTIRLATAGMRLDLGGIAKGYILQSALEELRRLGIRAAMLEAGGDIVAGDPPPGVAGWRIAKNELVADSTAISYELISNSSLATSGPSVQFVEIDGVRYSHVIDPRTGWALKSSLTAHVIDADGATADALATAATVIGLEGLYQLRARFPRAKIELVPT